MFAKNSIITNAVNNVENIRGFRHFIVNNFFNTWRHNKIQDIDKTYHIQISHAKSGILSFVSKMYDMAPETIIIINHIEITENFSSNSKMIQNRLMIAKIALNIHKILYTSHSEKHINKTITITIVTIFSFCSNFNSLNFLIIQHTKISFLKRRLNLRSRQTIYFMLP